MSVLIALGANSDGYQGPPSETLRWVLRRLPQFQVAVNLVSRVYRTAPVGAAGQAVYLNAVASVDTVLSPVALLRVLKRLEAEAGRDLTRLATAPRWVSRPLDLDILDYKGRVLAIGGDAAGGRRRRWPLCTPHPHAALRPFVIRPLLDVAPAWHHPVSHRSAAQLWVSLARREDGRILQEID